MSEDIIHFRLSNGDDIIGETVGETDDLFQVMNPMIIGIVDETLVMKDYLTFSELKVCSFVKSNVTSIAKVDTLFIEYYYNAIKYNESIVQPTTRETVRKVNKILDSALSSDNKAFVEAAKKYNVNLKKFNESSVH